MTKEELLYKAKEIVNQSDFKGIMGRMIKQVANTDLEKFSEYLKFVADQAWDSGTFDATVRAYGKELVDIAKQLHAEPDWIKNNPLHEKEIKGGKADKLSLKDISKKFNIEISNLEKELSKGISVEMEHTKDKSTAKDIAMDHLSEIPDYYTRLDKMEKSGNKKWSVKESFRRLIHQYIRG